jgi:hypothetical protein
MFTHLVSEILTNHSYLLAINNTLLKIPIPIYPTIFNAKYNQSPNKLKKAVSNNGKAYPGSP